MFKFNFSEAELGLEDRSDSFEPLNTSPNAVAEAHNDRGTASERLAKTMKRHEEETGNAALEDVKELFIEELAACLPHVISYSQLVVPLTGEPDRDVLLDCPHMKNLENASTVEAAGIQNEQGHDRCVTLVRRDLYDVRYQLMTQDDGDRAGESMETAALSSHIDNPSDLAAGVYEGGLKTWECSLDLVDCLACLEAANAANNKVGCRIPWARGKNILEIGCGTAIPTLYILQSLFSQSTPNHGEEYPLTQVTIQDYNDSVMRLVTFPNILLTWYTSPQAKSYRSSLSHDDDEDDSSEASLSEGGDMRITPALLSAFTSCLERLRISLRFLVGSWQAMVDDPRLMKAPYDLVLSSETIYQISSLASLVRLLKLTVTDASQDNIERSVEDLILDDVDDSKKQDTHDEERKRSLCLIAAKVLYFGVGGCVSDFERIIEKHMGKTMSVLQRKAGVGRTVLRVKWA